MFCATALAEITVYAYAYRGLAKLSSGVLGTGTCQRSKAAACSANKSVDCHVGAFCISAFVHYPETATPVLLTLLLQPRRLAPLGVDPALHCLRRLGRPHVRHQCLEQHLVALTAEVQPVRQQVGQVAALAAGLVA